MSLVSNSTDSVEVGGLVTHSEFGISYILNGTFLRPPRLLSLVSTGL